MANNKPTKAEQLGWDEEGLKLVLGDHYDELAPFLYANDQLGFDKRLNAIVREVGGWEAFQKQNLTRIEQLERAELELERGNGN